jgi:hypothetical protein
MLLEVVVMVATLAVAIAATSDEARSNMGGVPGVIIILVVTTAISVYLKFRAGREAQQDRQTMALLMRSSRPSDYVISLIDSEFDQVQKKNRPLDWNLKHSVSVSSPTEEGVRRTWFLIGIQNELLGFWTLSEEEVAEASAHAVNPKELRRNLERSLFGSWLAEGVDKKKAVADKVGSHIVGWLRTQHELWVKQWQMRWLLQEEQPHCVVKMLLEDGRQISLDFIVPPEFMSEQLEPPSYARAVAIAACIDRYMVQYVDSDLQLIDGRPNMSALEARVLSTN